MEKGAEIFIWRNGKKEGPISPRALEGAIRLGSIPAKTPAWTRNNPEWRTAAEILKSYSFLVIEHSRSAPSLLNPSPSSSHLARADQRGLKPNSSAPWWALGVGVVVACLLFLFLFMRHPNSVRAPYGNHQEPVESIHRSTEDEITKPSPRVEPDSEGMTANSVETSEHCVLMARTDKGCGTAFIVSENGRPYVYTNVHVASANTLNFTDFRGVPVQVESQGEVVSMSDSSRGETGIDIVRFPMIEPPKLLLKFASRPEIELKPDVWTLGDSGGESILKTLKGHITGVGPSKIEVDCEFIQGNSGGPIVTKEGQVVGIASYMTSNQSVWTKDTKQEVRRFAWIPGRDFHWTSTTSADLANEQVLVRNCLITNDLMLVISILEARKVGFHYPDNMPDVAHQVIALAKNHPLWSGIAETNRAVLSLSEEKNPSWAQSHREYARFYQSCVEYQQSQLEKAEKTIRSSFWKNELNLRIEDQRQSLENFRVHLKRYEEGGDEDTSLSSA